MIDNQSLLFDIDVEELRALQQIFAATENELLAAYHRALSRTTVTMKAQSNRLMRDFMDAKSLKVIRRRMQVHRYSFRLGKTRSDGLDELKLWFGLNDMKISQLKGRVARIGRKKNPQGARFTSKTLGSIDYRQGFVARAYGRRSIYQRASAARWPIKEAQVPIVDPLHVQLEDDVLVELPEVFMHHFKIDLKGRVAARGLVAERQHRWNDFRG